jgi:hypothetical protein
MLSCHRVLRDHGESLRVLGDLCGKKRGNPPRPHEKKAEKTCLVATLARQEGEETCLVECSRGEKGERRALLPRSRGKKAVKHGESHMFAWKKVVKTWEIADESAEFAVIVSL